MILPLKAKNPPDQFPGVTVGLIVVNCLVYLTTSEMFLVIKEESVKALALYPQQMSLLKMTTAMFLHGDIFHLAGNMLFLWLFGASVEGRLKWHRFLVLYLLAGYFGFWLQLAISGTADNIPNLGASGAIMGCLGAAMVLFPFAPVKFLVLWWYSIMNGDVIQEYPMWLVGLWYIGWDIFFGVLSAGAGAKGGTAYFAHVGGALFMALAVLALRIPRDSREVSLAKESFSDGFGYEHVFATQLIEMSQHRPHDYALTHGIVWRCLRENKPLPSDQIERFRRHLPQLLESESHGQTIGKTVLALVRSHPDALFMHHVLAVAQRTAQAQDPHLALALYDWVRQDRRSRDDDVEAALLAIAQIHERQLGNRDVARMAYDEFLQRFPLSPMANLARAGQMRTQN